MSLGRTRLAMLCPLHMRLYGGCGGGEVEERAEAEAAGGATVQHRGDSFGGRQQVPAVYEFELEVPQIQFLACYRDACPQCKLCRKPRKFHGSGAVLGVRRYACRGATTGPGVQPVQAGLELHSCSVLAVGAAAVGRGRRCVAAFRPGVGAHHTGDGLN